MELLGVGEKWAITATIITILPIASHFLNKHIDNSPPAPHLPDGQTALWVVAGVLYTLAGALGILTAWYGWEQAIRTVGIVVGCFVASGTLMILGDIRRSSVRRGDETTDNLSEARKILKSFRDA